MDDKNDIQEPSCSTPTYRRREEILEDSEDMQLNLLFNDNEEIQAPRRAAPGTLALTALYSTLAAHVERPALRADLIDGWRAGRATADIIVDVYRQHEELMLFETDLSIAPWKVIISNGAIVDFVNGEVSSSGLQLLPHQWDFIIKTLTLLVSSLRLSAYSWDSLKVGIIAQAVLKLLGSVSKIMMDPEAKSKVVEWDTLAPHLTENLVEFVTVVLDHDDDAMASWQISTINLLMNSFEALQKFSKLPAYMLRPLCKRVGATMRRRTHPVRKYLAFAVLELVADLLIIEDVKILEKWFRQDDPYPEYCYNYFDEDIKHIEDVVNAALPYIESASRRALAPGSEARSAALGLLLLFTHLLRQRARTSSDRSLYDLEDCYYSQLKSGNFTRRLMFSSVQILLDLEVRDFHPLISSNDFMSGLVYPLQLDVYSLDDAYELGALACFVLCETLRVEAYDANLWKSSLSPSATAAVEEVVRTAAAPAIRRRLLSELERRARELPGAVVRVRCSSDIVYCKVQFDDDTVELMLQLAEEHPLEAPVFTTSLSPAPSTFMISVFLMHENLSLVDALTIWIRMLGDAVQRAPQCSICLARVHEPSGRLPAVPCPQCRNKFHEACLRQWFRADERLNCPLCRSRFHIA